MPRYLLDHHPCLVVHVHCCHETTSKERDTPPKPHSPLPQRRDIQGARLEGSCDDTLLLLCSDDGVLLKEEADEEDEGSDESSDLRNRTQWQQQRVDTVSGSRDHRSEEDTVGNTPLHQLCEHAQEEVVETQDSREHGLAAAWPAMSYSPSSLHPCCSRPLRTPLPCGQHCPCSALPNQSPSWWEDYQPAFSFYHHSHSHPTRL
mmetsp:Transcript_31993/g.57857  ORF Transcript_31993/g.57857 Transcript_31993/m.57857 type:complete len:204 (+) Transcript_31993:336-947(+)